ncbi:MAG: reverse gyrase, partial [Candidatus Nezhaarchaeales archaeon]
MGAPRPSCRWLEGKMRALFKRACLNCGGDVDDGRLLLGLPCRRCLSDEEVELIIKGAEGKIPVEAVAEALEKKGLLKGLKRVLAARSSLREFESFFEKVLGVSLWSSQRTWARRVLLRKSFAIVAPTGVGKTVFGLAMAAFLASKGWKCYVISPTTLLVEQARGWLNKIISAAGLGVRLAYYSTALHKAEREEELSKIKAQNFDILVTTSSFLARNFELLKRSKFRFIFVDDVDAVLKSSKNIDRILVLLGFKQEEVEECLSLIKLRAEVARLTKLARAGREHGDVSELLERARGELDELGRRVADVVKRKAGRGVLVVSTATGRPRGLRVKLFRELLGFEVGSRSEAIRNVEDVFVTPGRTVEEEVVNLVRRLGGGGLVFVPLDKGVEYASKLTELLNASGVRAELVYSKGRREVVEAFVRREVDVLVGVASYYGLLVRGIDVPERIRYAIFAGVPKMKFTLELREAYPSRMLQLLIELREALPQEEQAAALRLIGRVRRLLWRLTPASFEELKKVLSEGGEPPRWLASAYSTIREAADFVIKALSRSEVREALKKATHLVLEEEGGKLKVTVPDVPTYIQASGRTSRMYAGGVSKGLSIVVIDDERVFAGLVRQSKWLIDEVKWRPLAEVELERLIEEVDADRERIRRLRSGEVAAEGFDPVKSVLLIVESPTKAKTIASFFGRPSVRRVGGLAVYEVGTGKYVLSVVATKGHVTDLVTRARGSIYGIKQLDGRFVPIYDSIKRCLSCGEQFVGLRECPSPGCESTKVSDSRDLIAALRSLALEFDYVYLGTDPDTEGEKISWDVACLLGSFSGTLKRIEFHEVTRPALQRALEAPRELNEALIEANIVRRIEDRWIGFELSRRLWRKFKVHTLSAGRVQTPVLGWVVKRFEEHKRSRRTVYSLVLSNGFRLRLEDVPAELSKREVVKRLKGATCRALKLEEGVEEVAPPPPFTTDSLLREASAVLKIGAAEAMALAQDLFELGLITYHRTDSTRVSATGRQIALEYIRERYGEALYQAREWASEGAHECIRPTRPLDVD